MANLKLQLKQAVDLGKIDSSIVVSGSNGLIGELVFSKGSLEWWPKGNHVNCKTYSWPELAKVLSANGTLKKAEKKVAIKRSKTEPTRSMTKPVTKRGKPVAK